MQKETFGELNLRETNSRQLGYTQDFADFVGNNQKVLHTSYDLIHEILSGLRKSSPVMQLERDGVSVSFIDHEVTNKHFKVESGDKTFFVKREAIWHEKTLFFRGHNAYNEIISSRRARELLKGLPGVRVINFQLAYRNKKESFFVSTWADLSEIDSKLLKKLESRIAVIKQRLKGYQNIVESNMFYDAHTDEIVLYDLHEGEVKKGR